MHVSRRRMLASLASAAATTVGLPGCNGGNTGPAVSSSTTYDTIVVGAGIAGITAARTAASYGAKVLILEAQSYVGGRAFTDNTTFTEIGFDLGAQFFHQALEGNDLFQIATAAGIATNPVASASPTGGGLPTLVSEGNAILAPTATDAIAWAATAGAIRTAILAYGLSVLGTSTDQSLATTTASLTSLPFFNDAVGPAVVSISGSLQRSTVDAYTYFSVSPGTLVAPGDDYLIKSGMGNFIASLAKGLPIQTNAPVKSIALPPSSSAGNLVTLTTASGQNYVAKTVIVTASVGALAAGGIAFSPALPATYTQGFAALPMANVTKVLMGFTKPGFSFTPTVSGFSIITPIGGSVQASGFGPFWNTNTFEFLIAGDLALQMETNGTAFTLATLLPVLENIFPGATAAYDGRITQSSWTSNPYTRGAYAAALTGQNGVRMTLTTPINNQLWFAGEALGAGGARGALHGAYRSGLAAANAAMRSVGLAQHLRRR